MTNDHATGAVRGDARWDAYRAGYIAGATDGPVRDDYERIVALAEGAASAYVDARPVPTPPHPTAPARGELACNGCGDRVEHGLIQPGMAHRCGGTYQPTPTGAGEAVDDPNVAAILTAFDAATRPSMQRAVVEGLARGSVGAINDLRDQLRAAREEAARLGRDVDVAVTSSKNWEAAYDEARSTLAARDAELAGVREREWRLRAAGGQLANCAYNLAQRTTLDESARRSLDSCRRQWDAILKRHTVEANHASDAARSGAGQEG